MPIPIKRRISPSGTLKLEGEGETLEFKLVFDFNALTLIEEKTKLNLLDGDIWKGLSPGAISVMLWASILACHPEYAGESGLECLRSNLNASNSDAVIEALITSFAASLPENKKKLYLELLEKAKSAEADDATRTSLDPTTPPGETTSAAN